jgi:hypothetical protein
VLPRKLPGSWRASDFDVLPAEIDDASELLRRACNHTLEFSLVLNALQRIEAGNNGAGGQRVDQDRTLVACVAKAARRIAQGCD